MRYIAPLLFIVIVIAGCDPVKEFGLGYEQRKTKAFENREPSES